MEVMKKSVNYIPEMQIHLQILWVLSLEKQIDPETIKQESKLTPTTFQRQNARKNDVETINIPFPFQLQIQFQFSNSI